MFRLPLPDLAVGGAGGIQPTQSTTPKNVQQQQGEESFVNSIYASLDGDKSANVTKSEAQPQISQGFNVNLGSLKNDRATEIFTQRFGTSNLGQLAKSVYNELSNNFKTVDSGKMEVTEAETAQAQQQLDSNANTQISAQIKSINDLVQSKYTAMLDAVNQQVTQEEENAKNLSLNDPTNQINNYADLGNNPDTPKSESDDNGEWTRHGTNVAYTTEGGTRFMAGKKGVSVQSGNVKLGTNFSKVSAGYNSGNFSASIQQNLKNGEGSLNISYRFKS